MSFELFISRRYLSIRPPKKSGRLKVVSDQKATDHCLWYNILSMAGVAVGVMALIIVIAVMAGFESDLKSRILGIQSHIVITHTKGNFSDYLRIVETVLSIDGVASAMPVVDTQMMLKAGSGMSGVMVKGIDQSKLLKGGATSSPIQGDLSGNGIILGVELAGNLGIIEGEDVYLISPRGMIAPTGHIPAMKRFEVKGIFKSGMYEHDASLAFIPINEARKMLRMEDIVTAVELRLKHITDAEEVAKKIDNLLGSDYQTQDWSEMNRDLFSALRLEKTAMFIILIMIILVAAFNIAGALIMMVMEKTRDIAILMAIGAKKRSIRRIFVFKGMAIGILGTTLGSLFGFAVCFLLKHWDFIHLDPNVYMVTTLPILLKPMDVMAIIGAVLSICFLSTLYPAHQASRINPVEAFRYG